MIKTKTKQHTGEYGRLFLQNIEHDPINICPECHYETFYKRNSIKRNSDNNGARVYEVWYCLNCKQETIFEVNIFFVETKCIIEIAVKTNRSVKSYDKAEKFLFTDIGKKIQCSECGTKLIKEPEIIWLKPNLPSKPKMYLNEDLDGFITPEEKEKLEKENEID